MWVIILSTGQGGYVTCSQAFLFSMVNPHGLGPTKLPLVSGQEERAIKCESNYRFGPTFGSGHDLFISANANTNSSCYSRLGNSYQCPPGHQKTFFTGVESFTVQDYEVFGLNNWRRTWNWIIQVKLHLFLLLYKGLSSCWTKWTNMYLPIVGNPC